MPTYTIIAQDETGVLWGYNTAFLDATEEYPDAKVSLEKENV